MAEKIIEKVEFNDYKEEYRLISENCEEWITIFEQYKNEENDIKNDIFVFSALLENDKEKIEIELDDFQWGFTPDSFGKATFTKLYNGSDEKIVFESGDKYDKYEYLIAYRTFDADYEKEIEINPKLIWYNNLVKVSDGYIEPFSKDYKIKVSENKIEVMRDYLRDFLSAYNKVCIVGFDNRRFFKQDKGINKNYITNKNNNFVYCISVDKDTFSNYNYFSSILGKIIVNPFKEPQHTDYKYFYPDEKYEEFIIAVDQSTGKEIYYTCNENKLSNFFGANKGAPNFLTPVYFDKQVLDKYTNNPAEYFIEDDHIGYLNQWSIPYNINSNDKVSVWLGDLGRIPNKEQMYWKSFNINPYGGMNEKFLQRQLGAKFTDTIRDEKRLIVMIEKINGIFYKKYNDKLFKDLNEADLQIKNAFSIPTNNSTTSYQTFLMQICKLTVERINTKLIKQVVNNESLLKGQDGNNLGSRLQLKIMLDNLEFNSSNQLDEILKKVYNSRNKLAGHTGSFKEYNKVWKRDEAYRIDFISDSKDIVKELNDALDKLYDEAKNVYGE